MKISLVVASPGKMNQRAIAIYGRRFLIGREADCQLRPGSPMVSRHHCAVLMGEDAAFIQDLGSCNGTFLNEQPVRGKLALHDEDVLRVGPLLFTVRLETPASALPKQQQLQPSRETSDEEAVAALLLSMPDKPDKPKPQFEPDSRAETGPPIAETGVDPGTIPVGARTSEPKEASEPKENDAARDKTNPGNPDRGGSTALAAKAILKNYQNSRRVE